MTWSIRTRRAVAGLGHDGHEQEDPLKLTRRRTGCLAITVAAMLATTACTGGADSSPRGTSAGASPTMPTMPTTPPAAPATADASFAALEASSGARVGVYVRDTATGRTVTWRSGERFPFASTIKAPLAGAVLQRVSRSDLSRVVRFDQTDLVPSSPVTEQHVDDGMTLRELLDAALRFSDNTAANLLFEQVGGPPGLDRALDALGDRVTDPQRIEPDLNTAVPGEARDTTTPRAIATTVGAYLLGDTLPEDDRELLRTLMTTNTTGDDLIRASVPGDWVVADKTGGAAYGVRNDVAVAFPPGRGPVLIAVMTRRGQADDRYDDAVVAEATRIAVGALD
jgi:beta-lactamase class A